MQRHALANTFIRQRQTAQAKNGNNNNGDTGQYTQNHNKTARQILKK